ncbi:MAG TPA: GntR family transcriptional regulator [Sphingobium sp.]
MMTAHLKPPRESALLIKRQEGVPLWSQVKSTIIEMIVDANMPEHASLPSEAELCTQFGVSRIVVREALNQLVAERLVYKHQGRGAFVAAQREEQDFVSSMIGFSGELSIKHKTVTRTILLQELQHPASRVRKYLNVDASAEVVQIDRVMHVDGIPRTFVRNSILHSAAPGLHKVALGNRSLYDTLNRQYGLVFEGAERWIEATSAGKDEAQLLKIPERTPLLSIESRASAPGGIFVEYYHALFRTDQARLHFVVRS